MLHKTRGRPTPLSAKGFDRRVAQRVPIGIILRHEFPAIRPTIFFADKLEL